MSRVMASNSDRTATLLHILITSVCSRPLSSAPVLTRIESNQMHSFLQVKICDIRNVKKISEANFSVPGCSAALELTFLDESSITFGMKTGERPHNLCR